MDAVFPIMRAGNQNKSRMKIIAAKVMAAILVAGALLGGCQPRESARSGDAKPGTGAASLFAAAQTTPTLADGATDPAILIDADNPANSLILGSGLAGGLEMYGLDGVRIGVMPERPIGLVDVRPGFPFADGRIDLILAHDAATTELVAYRMDESDPALQEISSEPMLTEMDVEGLCTYRSPISGATYAFAAGAGTIQQWQLHDSGGTVAGRRIRTIPVGHGAGHCVVDDRESTLYYSQETVGLWKLNAEPESAAEAELIDLAAPHGRFEGDVKGVAIVALQAGGGYLVVSDADVNLLHVYDLASEDHLGVFSVDAGAGIGAVDESEGMAATGMALSGEYGDGLLVLADDDNDGEHTNYKLVSWSDAASALDLPRSAGGGPGAGAGPATAIVRPSVETDPVASYGDAADDPAVWVHPERPELSVVIGSQKKKGINVYDLGGRLLQSRPDGRINNVDVRYGFGLGGDTVDIVAGSNRSSDSISIYGIDPASRTLFDIADGVIPTGMSDPYGLCMYRSPSSGLFYVFVNDTDGVVRQWLLRDAGNGRVGAEPVREFSVGSQTEGCVADDVTGDLYVGEENVAVWKYAAEPRGGEARTRVDGIDGGNLTGDIEGIAILRGAGQGGYLVVSDQGVDSFALYRLEAGYAYLGHFHVVADVAAGIDGVSETDGIEVTGANLGPAFPQGVFIAQDGRNITPAERQNFKLVPWERIAAVMGLEAVPGYDPRAPGAAQ